MLVEAHALPLLISFLDGYALGLTVILLSSCRLA